MISFWWKSIFLYYSSLHCVMLLSSLLCSRRYLGSTFSDLNSLRKSKYNWDSAKLALKSGSLIKYTHGTITKNAINVSNCKVKVMATFPWPMMTDPRNIMKNPKNSVNHPKNVIWMLRRWRRCRMSLLESESSFRSFLRESWWVL